MTRRLLPLPLLTLALAPLMVPRRSGATPGGRYTVVDLGTLGGPNSAALSLNERGTVVGWAETPDLEPGGQPVRHAFLWNGSSGMRDLGALPGLPGSEARDVNDRGEVVGRAFDPGHPFPERAFRWAAGTGLRALPGRQGGESLWANAVNERGDIVGAGTRSGFLEALIWRAGRPQFLFHRTDRADALDVNNRGEIAVTIGDALANTAGFLARPGGEPRLLSRPEIFCRDSANGLNERGQVAGEIRHGAFVWGRGRLTLLPRLAGYCYAAARAINAGGQVVGTARYGVCEESSAPENTRAVLWQRGRVFDLNGLLDRKPPHPLIEATKINDRGEIAAVMGDPGGDAQGLRRAVLLRPVRD